MNEVKSAILPLVVVVLGVAIGMTAHDFIAKKLNK